MQYKFYRRLAIWIALCLLATTDLGSIPGVVFGFGIAVLAGALGPTLANAVLITAGVLLAAAALVRIVTGWVAWSARSPERAYASWSAAIPLVAVPAFAVLSVAAMTRSWP